MSTPLANTSELALPSDGLDNDVWGLENNSLHAGWDRFLGGWVNQDMSAADWTVSNDEAQNGRMWLTGSSSAARSVILPSNKFRTWVVLNLVSGSAPFMRIAQASSTIDIPQNTIAVIMSIPGALFFAGPPVDPVTGGFQPSLVQPGFGYFGPSLFFNNRQVGFGSPTPGFLSVYLAAVNAQAELRFQSTNTAAVPMIAALRSGAIWDSGLYFPGGTEVAVAALGQQVARFTTSGVAVGAANGPAGPGTVNASQFMRSGQVMPFQFPVYLNDLGLGAFSSTPHGIGGPPTGIFGRLRCVQADLGYNVGDLITASQAGGLTFGADASSAFWCSAGDLVLPRKGTGAAEVATRPRWRLDLILCWP
jgi:hypothetical protein